MGRKKKESDGRRRGQLEEEEVKLEEKGVGLKGKGRLKGEEVGWKR